MDRLRHIFRRKALWFVAGSIVVFVGVAGAVGLYPSKQVSEAEAAVACQKFYDEVKANVSAMDGYSIIGSKKSCSPSIDEAGATDYYFNVLLRVTKAGNDTVEGITANSHYLADHYPRTKYAIWARNDADLNGQHDTICFAAATQIQENGEIYSSYPEDHYYADYVKPGSLPDYKPCDGL